MEVRILKKNAGRVSLALILAGVGLFILSLSYFHLRLFPWTPRRLPSIDMETACRSVRGMILGAIEMYNMDHSEPIDRYDPSVLEKLFAGGYLKPATLKCPGSFKPRTSWPWLQQRLETLARNINAPDNHWISERKIPPGTFSGSGLSSGGKLVCSLHGRSALDVTGE